MAHYTAKYGRIEAVQFNGFPTHDMEAKQEDDGKLHYYCATSKGRVEIQRYDWIVTTNKGEKFVFDNAMFRSCYEPEVAPGITTDGKNCNACGQRIAKRKVMFASALTGALIKAFFRACEKDTDTVIMGDLQLNHSEYNRMNDLVRFGLLYRSKETMRNGEYGVPKKRIREFLNNQWPVAAYFYKDPVNDVNEMSEQRIFFRDVPNVAEVVQTYGNKLTEYVPNFMFSNPNVNGFSYPQL